MSCSTFVAPSCAFPHEKTAPQWCPSADLTEGGFGQIRIFGAISPRFCCVLPRFWRLPRGRLLNPALRHPIRRTFAAVSHSFAVSNARPQHSALTFAAISCSFAQCRHNRPAVVVCQIRRFATLSPHFCCSFAAIRSKCAVFGIKIRRFATI